MEVLLWLTSRIVFGIWEMASQSDDSLVHLGLRQDGAMAVDYSLSSVLGFSAHLVKLEAWANMDCDVEVPLPHVFSLRKMDVGSCLAVVDFSATRFGGYTAMSTKSSFSPRMTTGAPRLPSTSTHRLCYR